MCYHKLYIFATCGHSFWQPLPLEQCGDASMSPSAGFSSACQPRSHPFQTRKIYELCLRCRQRRDGLLAEAEKRGGEVRFEEWKWRMKYQSPQAEENAWKTWGEAGASSSSGDGNRNSRMGRMSDLLRAGLRRSGGGGGGVERR
ncbi:hypothetical protein GTA08_BOTSDO02360 [Neofusicoccum parvum]|nr:hypothetical protein GTA08_BOTSDO02360 [Neofusicoccum parvum]